MTLPPTTEEPATGLDADDANEPPAFDQVRVSRVASRVEIRTVEMVGAHFERSDDGPLPVEDKPEARPEIGVNVEWELDDALLGCLVSFTTLMDEPAPYRFICRYRLLYDVRQREGLEEIEDDDLLQFGFYNAVFNAWPYWREYLASTLNRAQLPRFTVPVLALPAK